MSLLSLFEIAAIAVLLACSAFFSGSEAAFLSLDKISLQTLSKKKSFSLFLENPVGLLITILIGNELVNVAASSLATSLFINMFVGSGVPEGIVVIISIAVMLFVLLIAGEITPKTLAVKRSKKFMQKASGILQFLFRLLSPVRVTVNFIVNAVIRLFGIKSFNIIYKKLPITEEELKTLVTVGEKRGIIEEQEKVLIHNIFEMSDTLIRDLMIPRIDIISVPLNAGVEEIIKIYGETGYSRLPVYGRGSDDIRGVLYIKDFLKIIKRNSEEAFSMASIIREPLFVPETKKARELLREFQTKKMQIAFVVNEFGETIGLITFEDIVEEIFGEIYDEYEFEVERKYQKTTSGEYLLSGRLELYEFDRLFGTKVPDREYNTISGLVIDRLGRIPVKGETFDYEGLRFTVEEIERKRILKVRVGRIQG